MDLPQLNNVSTLVAPHVKHSGHLCGQGETHIKMSACHEDEG